MRIKETIDKLPGGLMLAPLLLGALCKTFAPNAPAYFKGFTQGIMTGVIPILAVWFFCMGASIKLSATGTVLRKSGTLVLTKFFAAWAIVLVASQFIPPEGIQSGIFAGLSILAIVCAVDMTNGGLYASLMQTYGTKEEAGAFVLISIESGPLMSMIILGASGAAHFEPQVFVGAVLPFLVGFALGNLDPKLREFFAPGGVLMIPFFAFALGNTIDLHSLLSPLAGLGVALALSVIVLTGVPLIIADKLIGRGTGTAGIAASSTAGAAAANPVAIAAVAPQFAPAVPQATVLVAICIVVTSIVVPILTGLWYRRFGRGAAEQASADSLGPALQLRLCRLSRQIERATRGASAHNGERKAVPALGADGLDRGRAQPWLARHQFEHAAYADDVRAAARRVDHLALPHHIVDHDRCSWPGKAQSPFEIGRVVGLVGVDEHKVERSEPLGLELGQRRERCAGSDLDFVAKTGVGDVSARNIGVFGAHFERDEPTVVRQGARQPDRRIAAERADLERFARP